ncbi:ankyrin repeat domain-containing protein 65-like [Haliotis cracherodii]|uniref:ankyrin repeat domain-containing protein 65-like n=1 Tax=Haliotis cracherodii TaxID=6455 RepID=UPI0039ECE62F
MASQSDSTKLLINHDDPSQFAERSAAKILRSFGCIFIKGNSGSELLASAVYVNDNDLISYIIAMGIIPDVKSTQALRGSPYLPEATDHISQKVLSFGVQHTWTDHLMLVALYEEVDILKLLCEMGARLDIRDNAGKTVLHKAVWTEVDAAEKLLYLLEGQNVPIDALDNRGRTALFPAVEFGDLDVVELLCQKGFDLQTRDKHGTSLLHASCRRGLGDFNNIRMVIACGDITKRRVRHVAVRKQALDAVHLLLKDGVNVNAMDEYGRTPLHYATEFRQSDIMKLLLENGANPCFRDTKGMTPLHRYAERDDRIDSKSFLGASVHTSNMDQMMAEPDSVSDLTGDCISLLSDYGAELNIQDDEGRTVLHVTAEEKRSGNAKRFLEKGADPCCGSAGPHLSKKCKVNRDWDPGLGTRDPGPGTGTRDSGLGTRDSGLGTRDWDLGLGTRDSGPGTGTWDSGLGTGDPVLGTRDSGLGSGDSGPGTGDLGLGTRDWGLGTRDQRRLPQFRRYVHQ